MLASHHHATVHSHTPKTLFSFLQWSGQHRSRCRSYGVPLHRWFRSFGRSGAPIKLKRSSTCRSPVLARHRSTHTYNLQASSRSSKHTCDSSSCRQQSGEGPNLQVSYIPPASSSQGWGKRTRRGLRVGRELEADGTVCSGRFGRIGEGRSKLDSKKDHYYTLTHHRRV